MYVVKDLVPDMNNFYEQYRCVAHRVPNPLSPLSLPLEQVKDPLPSHWDRQYRWVAQGADSPLPFLWV